MIYHIVVGDAAATPLSTAILEEPSMAGEVIVLRDLLHLGPIAKIEGSTFSEMRTAYWQEVADNISIPVDDTERVLAVSARMYKEEDVAVWFWMAPWPADVCAYKWLIKYMSKHKGRFFIVNIANLPFLNEAGKVYYPKNISEIIPRELVKARKLARLVTPAEVEIDGDEWFNYTQDNAPIRSHEGGKKIMNRTADYYDEILLSFITSQWQKAGKIVQLALSKQNIPTGDIFLGWRLKVMAANGQLQVKGDTAKSLKDWEVALQGAEVQEAVAAE